MVTFLGVVLLSLSLPDAISAPKPKGQCIIGNTGPGGGIIFYDARSVRGRCLEAAPANWSGAVHDPKAPWCNIFNISFTAAADNPSFLGITIGKGQSNTNLLMLTGCSSGAGILARAYHGGGKTDWFLPSKNELHAMYINQAAIGGFAAGVYWSSSENDANGAWVHYFKTNNQYLRFKGIPNSVRPIRAF